MHVIEIERGPEASIVLAQGELDAFAAQDITASFEQVSGSHRVVADLSAVSFLDSTALGLLVRAVRELRERGAGVRVVLPTGTAARIFEITTLDLVLPISGSRAEAIAELRG